AAEAGEDRRGELTVRPEREQAPGLGEARGVNAVDAVRVERETRPRGDLVARGLAYGGERCQGDQEGGRGEDGREATLHLVLLSLAGVAASVVASSVVTGSAELVDVLGRLSLFADFSRPELQAVAHAVDEEMFGEGQRVLRQGL